MNFLQLLLGLVAGTLFSLPAPVDSTIADPTILNCASDELHAERLATDPKFAAETARMEEEWAKSVGKIGGKSSTAPPYVLPIVFHIVHENGTENLPEADILRSVDYLNQALANINYYDPATGVDTEIQVCMARRSPNNQPTNGINRIVSPLTELNADDDRQLKDLSRWAPREYVNVWVVKEICGLGLGCGVAGYAYYPSAHGRDIDGIVMEARWLADDEADATVLVHELGHYLGLRHTFGGGCANDDCTRDGDRVCDTPPDQSTVAVPCTGSANSCFTDTDSGPFTADQDDMHINYMDYGYFRCYSAFTTGQRERMHFFLEGRRRSLLESKGCEEPCPAVVTAGFTGGDVAVEAGSTVSFTNTSVNGEGFVWRENGVEFGTTTDISRVFPNVGTYRIQLLAQSANLQLCRADSMIATVRVVCSVEADFRTLELPRAEVPLTFENTSSGGGQSTWTINGAPAGTDEGLVHTFATPGFFEVCLTESNGVCEDQRCLNLVVLVAPCSEPGCGGDTLATGGCGASLQLNYVAEEGPLIGNFTHLLDYADGFIVGGNTSVVPGTSEGAQAMVMRVNERGEILWQRKILSNGTSILEDLVIDEDGFLVGFGTSNGQGRRQNFVFRIDMDTGTVPWVKLILSEISTVSLSGISQPSPNANYYCFGGINATTNQADGLFFQMNPTDGSIVLNSAKVYDIGLDESFSRVDHHSGSNNFYVVGQYRNVSPGNIAPSNSGSRLTAFDINGNLIWSRLIWKEGSSLSIQGSFITDVEMDNDTVVVLAWSQDSLGQPFKEILRFDLNGEILDAFAILNTDAEDVSDSGYLSMKLLVNQAGYSMNNTRFSFTNFTSEDQVTQVSRSGTVLWSKTFQGAGGPTHKGIATDESGIALVFRDGRNGGMHSILKLSPMGDASTCIPQDTSPVITRPETIRNAPMDLEAEETFLFTFDGQWGEGDLKQVLFTCPEDCPEEENPDCTAPFRFQLTENDAVDDGIFTAVTSRNGLYYVGGRVNNSPYLAALRANGEIVWQRVIATISEQHTIRHLNFDDEGMLVGVSSLSPNTSPNPTIFKIDPVTGNAVWVRQLLQSSGIALSTLLVGQPGANYRLIGRSDASGLAQGFIVDIDRATGMSTTPITVFSGATIGGFSDGVINPADGVVYALSNTLQATFSQLRVTAIDPNNGVVWDKSYGLGQDEVLVKSLDWIDGRLVATGILSGEAGRSVVLTLGSDGNLERAVMHSYLGTSLSIQGVADRRNSDLLELLFYDAVQSRWLLSRQGFPIIDVLNNSRSGTNWVMDPRSTQSFSFDGAHLLVAGRYAIAGSPVLDALRVDSTFLTQVCENEFYFPSSYSLDTINVVERDLIPINPTNSIDLITSTTELSPGRLSLAPDGSCPQDCFPEEICDNQLDDDQDGLIDCDDPDLAQDCCCLPSPIIDLGPDTLLCPGDVLREGTDRRFARYEWSTGARTDSIVISEADTYWLMVTDSCGRTASDTLTLHLRSRPLLELGRDTTLCANAIVPFLAQDGFATYEWTDGTTEKDFTAFEAGTYWVVATDSCGGVQTDTVRVNVDPATVIDLGPDTTICPGDVLTFRVDGFNNYQWSQSSFIDCFDCPEVRFAPTTDTLLLLAAQQGPGCLSSDSIRVRIAEATGSRDSVYLCPGDSVSFGAMNIFEQGQYYDLQEVVSCEVTDTLDVFALRDTLTSEVMIICEGDSALVFGDYEREAFLYRRTYTIGNGCDSTHQVDLIVRDTSRTAETIGICGGDSVLIFGVYEREPGTYSQTFVNTAGCDSTHEVTLEVNEILISTRQIRPDCGGSNPGWGEVLFESDGTFEVRWSDGSYFKRNERLFADIIYTVTVTESNGCSVVDSLVVDAAVPPEVQTLVTDESCPGANDGEISIIHDRDDLRFRIEQGPYLETSTFQNLADGTYRITIQDGDGCTSRVDLLVAPPEDFALELSETNLLVSLGDSVVITPFTEYSLSELRWLIDGELICTGCRELRLKPTQSVLITAIAGDNNDCAVTAEARLNVSREDLFYVPSAFSPNGDTLNEDFRVYSGPAVTRILSFEVFDRWGGRVFQRKDYAPEDTLGNWDGMLANGQGPNLGVYVYQVQVELFTGEVVSRAGEVLVMR